MSAAEAAAAVVSGVVDTDLDPWRLIVTTHPGSPVTPALTRSPLRLAAAVVGVVFLLVGILGFVPGITTDYDMLGWAGHHSGAKLLGVFAVSALHNVVHLLFGVAGLALSRTAASSRAYLIGGGIVYAILWIYGLVVDESSSANFVPLNTADNWLHLVLAAGMILLGLVLPAAPTPGTRLVDRTTR